MSTVKAIKGMHLSQNIVDGVVRVSKIEAVMQEQTISGDTSTLRDPMRRYHAVGLDLADALADLVGLDIVGGRSEGAVRQALTHAAKSGVLARDGSRHFLRCIRPAKQRQCRPLDYLNFATAVAEGDRRDAEARATRSGDAATPLARKKAGRKSPKLCKGSGDARKRRAKELLSVL